MADSEITTTSINLRDMLLGKDPTDEHCAQVDAMLAQARARDEARTPAERERDAAVDRAMLFGEAQDG